MSKNPTTISFLIIHRQLLLGMDDDTLSAAIGFPSTNVIPLLKRGSMRLPLNRVKALAKALEADPVMVLRLAISESVPGLLEIIDEILNPLNLSAAEVNLVRHCRRLAGKKKTTPLVIDGREVIALITV
ncbi:hypothetical protein [Variovorax ginsengisoli]|uniref:XRE family transcriptional regulator n=1 Tax=Variovorax ginsengisoli TaxID=363844 RepID=A0ABT9SCR2_9BURK|nr:hypothetical protein [Variovorax ginsengisoli]MDP9902143.1 hypothetical protein [Variovorax ginsengisoli]